MLKKLSRLAAVSAVALIAGMTGAHANPAVNQPDGSLYKPLTGFYIGGYGGYEFDHLRISGGGTTDPDGVDYGGFVGYSLDTLIDHYTGLGLTAAIEGHYGYANARDHTDIFGVGVTTRERDQWGFDFRPGLTVVNQYLPFGLKPYGIFGYDRTKFDASSGFGSGSAHYNGFELGAGTEFLVYDHIGLRADYEHVFYGDNDGIHPQGNELRLGAALHF